MVNKAELLFSEVLNTLRQIAEKISGVGTITSMRKMELRRQIAGLEAMLQKEKAKFEVNVETRRLFEHLTTHPKFVRKFNLVTPCFSVESL